MSREDLSGATTCKSNHLYGYSCLFPSICFPVKIIQQEIVDSSLLLPTGAVWCPGSVIDFEWHLNEDTFASIF